MAFSSIDDPSSRAELFDFSNESKEAIITAAYKQVFGNAYLMEEERAELATAESQFKLGESDVRTLVRAMGKSEEYRKRFFERCGPYRFVELNCKHFLGRAPLGQEEVSFHVQKLMNEGYDAEIDSYIDSEEYNNVFGRDAVPRFIFMGEYPSNDDFNKMCMLRAHWDGCSTSTRTGSTAPGLPNRASLCFPPGAHCGNPMAISEGILAGHDPAPIDPAVSAGKKSLAPLNARAPVRIRIKVAENLYQVFETDPLVDAGTPSWKKEREGSKRWNGVWF